MTSTFTRILRFEDYEGATFYGELGSELEWQHDLTGLEVPVFDGQMPWDQSFRLSPHRKKIRKVLCPIASVPIFECVGINYKAHVAEAGLPRSEYPVIFTKPPDALAGPFDDITINEECKFMDYEAELCVILGKDCKDVKTRADAESVILGYTAGNDVSSRYWQMPERSGNQHGPSKSFDKFAPIGPAILHPSMVNKEHGLRIRSIVNGEVRQDARTNDLIFDVPDIIIHLSRGATLRRGTVIMTGTPGGVAAFMKPPQWLQSGDIVEIEIENIGKMANRMVFESG